MLKSLKPNKKPEDKRIPKEEKEELTRLKSCDPSSTSDYYLNLSIYLFFLIEEIVLSKDICLLFLEKIVIFAKVFE